MGLETVTFSEVQDDPLTREIIGAATERGVRFSRQLDLPVNYRGQRIGCSYRLDFLVEDRVVVELKSVDAFEPVHQAQLLTYLRLSGKRVGLLLNFNTPYLRDGIKRMVL